MTMYDVPAFAGLSGETARARVSEVVAACGLRVALETTLATDPGSMHWHFKLGDQAGVLELTISPRTGTATLSVHANRMRKWIPAAAEAFIAASQPADPSADA